MNRYKHKAKSYLPSFLKNEQQLEKFARFGYIAKGVVYCIVGILAASAAFTAGGQTTGKSGAVEEILQQPFGQILLFLVAVGLLGYVAFRGTQAMMGNLGNNDDKKEMAKRIGYVASAISYLALSVYSFYLIFSNSGGGGGGSSKKSLIATVLDWPAGSFIIGIIAIGILIKGVYQFYKGATEKFKEDIRTGGSKIRDMYEKVGKAGYISRGIVICILGYFMMKAALESNANSAKGTGGVFDFLQSTGGPWLMGLIALGIIAYGIFMFVKARYGKLKQNFA